ncbi:MAG TPA: hypothetical protein VH518_13805 [Tepidisphaeraceae bacterium]|jgi:hypothetical protein
MRSIRPARHRKRRRTLLLACALPSVTCLATSLASGQVFTWNNSAGGLFKTAVNWTPSGPPNTSAEGSAFSLNGVTYTVQFDQDFSNNVLNFNSGTVNFSGLTTQRTYSLAGNAALAGGVLTLGPTATTPMTLTIGATLIAGGGHVLHVNNGSDVTLVSLNLGNSSGDATIAVSGTGSTFHCTGATAQLIGRLGHLGDLSFDSGAAGTFDGPIGIVQTSNANTTGQIELSTGATLAALSSIRVGDNDGTAQSASITVTGAGSAFNQIGAGTISLGGSTDSTGDISVFSSGAFNSGTGTTTVHELGTLHVSGGSFNANGTLVLSGGQISVATGGAFNAASLVTATGGQFSISGGSASFNGTFASSGSTINISGGSAIFNGAFAPSGSTINVSGGALNLPAGTTTFSGGTLALSGTGTTNLGPGRTLSVISNGTLSSSIDLHTNGGTVLLTGSNLRMSTKALLVVGTVQFSDSGGVANSLELGVDGDGIMTLNGSNAKLATTDTGFFNTDIGFLGNHGTLSLTNGAGVENSGGLDIATSLTAGTSGVVTVAAGCRMTLGDNLRIAGQSGASTGLLSVSGASSTFDGAGTCTIGAASLSAGTFSVTSGGSASIGGTLTINKTGLLLINSSTFTAGGSVILNGGVLHRTGGSFSQGIATIFEINNDGTAIFDNGIHVSSDSQIFHLFNGHLDFDTGVRLGASGTGSITADGSSATLFIGTTGATVGFGSGGRGTLELRNSAVATILGPTRVGMNSSTGSLLVNSNASVQFGSVLVGVTGGSGSFSVQNAGSTTLGNLSIGIDGTGTMVVAGATVAQTGAASVVVGGASGTGSLLVQGAATFISGTGSTNVTTNGLINISTGTFVANGLMIERGGGSVIIGGTTNAWTGSLDLTDRDRIIDYTGASPLATVANQIKSATTPACGMAPG